MNRRRFLETAATTAGAGLLGPGAARAVAASPAADEANETVRLSGDGVGLSAAEYARLLNQLATARAIPTDSFSIGGVVTELEREMASFLGKERAVYMPTGTLANHLAIRVLAGGPSRVIVQAESHLYNDEGDCAQTLSGLTLVPLGFGRATFTLDEVREIVERTAGSRAVVPVSVISVESPVRRARGQIFDTRELERIIGFAREKGIRLHLDGARLPIEAAFAGRRVTDYTAAFDTVYVSLYKYFNAASGAILAGPARLMDDLYHVRRMFGGSLSQAWPSAAVALHYATGFSDRYGQAVAVSREWSRLVAAMPGFTVESIPSGTNLFYLRLQGVDLEAFRTRLRARGIMLPAPQADGSGFLLGVNETWNRTTAARLAEAMKTALQG
jgi:threonine aldolase